MQNITISNKTLTVQISPKGAELQSIIKDGAEYIWQGDPAFWDGRAPVLFPIVGALKNGRYNYKGKSYTLPQHGFARSMVFDIKEAGADFAVFSLSSSAETLQNYPFEFELLIRYQLKDNILDVKYTVINKTDREMYFSIGAHEGYTCPIVQGEQFTDCYMEFDAPVTQERYLIEGRLIALENEPFLNSEKTFDLKHDYFNVDALVFKGNKSKWLALKSRKSPRAVKVTFEGFPFLAVWQKPGAHYICIEPWYGIADSVNASGELTQKEGIMRLDKNGMFECTHWIEIS